MVINNGSQVTQIFWPTTQLMPQPNWLFAHHHTPHASKFCPEEWQGTVSGMPVQGTDYALFILQSALLNTQHNTFTPLYNH